MRHNDYAPVAFEHPNFRTFLKVNQSINIRLLRHDKMQKNKLKNKRDNNKKQEVDLNGQRNVSANMCSYTTCVLESHSQIMLSVRQL